MNLVKLEPKTDPREVIATLEEVLTKAKDGKIESIVIVYTTDGGGISTRFSGYNTLQMIGACELVKNDMIKGAEI